jgi:hypothetical protein
MIELSRIRAACASDGETPSPEPTRREPAGGPGVPP